MPIGYSQYVTNEIELIMCATKKRLAHPLYKTIFGEDIPYRLMVATTIGSLKTKEFLIYFMQNQERLVAEQKLTYIEYGLEYKG